MQNRLHNVTMTDNSFRSPDSMPARETGRRLTDDDRRYVYRKFRDGAALKDLAREHNRSPATIRRTVHSIRIHDLWGLPIEYVYHESFDNRALQAEIVGPAPEAPPQRLLKAPSGLPPYLAGLYEIPLLTREQEAHWFRKLNYLKYQAARLRERLDPARVSSRDLDRLEELLRLADDVKSVLIRSNLRLVVSVAKQCVRTEDFLEIVSDGNMALIRAIEKFDFSRGFKFSTYATWAIRNTLARSIPAERSHQVRFLTGSEEFFAGSSDGGIDQYKQERTQEQHREAVERILQHLSERERYVLTGRYGLGHGREPQTLEQVGNQLGVTKERVRQLEKRAILKLHDIAVREKVDIPGIR